MVKWTGRPLKRAGQGFTLVELLLALALMLLFVSAAVFSFSSLLRGNQLEEGAGQVESLMRFARAQAANTGRKVQLVFEEETNSTSFAASIRVRWEPDPLGEPGVFADLAEAGWQAQAINGLVQAEAVQLLGSGDENSADSTGSPADVSGPEADAGVTKPLSPITFYPDGSSDSAEIILVSLAPDDENRMSVRIEGLSGAIRHQLVSAEPGDEPEQSDVQQQKQNTSAERAKRPVEVPTATAVPNAATNAR
jgi:prepilin-type N-terminal cleavage/methylation domain-containing protein